MQHSSHILIRQLCYSTSDHQSLFNELNLSLGSCKTALVGRNGIGKSTLIKLIIGELSPYSGSIHLSGQISYCPQTFSFCLNKTVAEVLGVKEKLAAIERITAGSLKEQDYELLNDDWEIKERVEFQLTSFGLAHIALDRLLHTLSGGEVTRIGLVRLFLNNSEILILDEPTNNLDLQSRTFLYRAIEKWSGCLLVVSHDRALLDLVDQIVELSSLGVRIYGGNYSDYMEQKEKERAASERGLKEAKQDLKKTRQRIQLVRERHDKRESHGNQSRKSGSQAKMILDSMKERSGGTKGKLLVREERLLKERQQTLKSAKAKIEVSYEINVRLPKTFVPNNKIILKLEDLSFDYNENSKKLIDNFSLTLQGPERVALVGENGSGKTTLVKLIQGELKPTKGKVSVGVSRFHCFDQHAHLLDPDLSVLDNYRRFNSETNEMQARYNLADFLFRARVALKYVRHLSGGERLRALLACVLTSSQPPKFIILDEPTNHLDFESIISLESALNCYQGAMIIISHDESFLQSCRVEKIIRAPYVNMG